MSTVPDDFSDIEFVDEPPASSGRTKTWHMDPRFIAGLKANPGRWGVWTRNWPANKSGIVTQLRKDHPGTNWRSRINEDRRTRTVLGVWLVKPTDRPNTSNQEEDT